MSEELAHKINTMEHKHTRLDVILEQMARDISSIQNEIRSALVLEQRLATVEKSQQATWDRIDEHTAELKEFAAIATEHATCKPKVEKFDTACSTVDQRLKVLEEKANKQEAFMSSRMGNLLDKVIWVGLTVITTVAVIMALKGFMK